MAGCVLNFCQFRRPPDGFDGRRPVLHQVASGWSWLFRQVMSGERGLSRSGHLQETTH